MKTNFDARKFEHSPSLNERKCAKIGKRIFFTIYKIIVPILCICRVSNLHEFNLFFCHLRSKKPPEQGKGSDFSYLGKYDPLLVEGWRPGQPNGNRGRGNNNVMRKYNIKVIQIL